jgi:hypothetical protein
MMMMMMVVVVVGMDSLSLVSRPFGFLVSVPATCHTNAVHENNPTDSTHPTCHHEYGNVNA